MTKIMKGGLSYCATSNMVALTQAQYDALSTAQKNNGNFYFITDANPSYFSATNIDYNNTDSGLTATDIQDAIDEVVGSISDTKVTQTATSNNAYYEVLFSGTADNTTRTESAGKYSNLTFNPSTGDLNVTQINGVTVGASPKFTDTTYTSKSAVSGGTDVSLCTTGEKYNWNTSPRMTTNTYPTLFDQDGNNNWIRVGTNNSYGLLPPNSGGAGSGHGYLGTSSWYWYNLYVDNANIGTLVSSNVLNRNSFVASGTSYSADNMRGQTRFLYTTHGVPYTGTTVSFDSSNNDNYSLQLNGSYSAGKMFFRTRYGDKNTWNDWIEVCQRKQFTAVNAGSSATYYIPTAMRGAGNGQDNQYLLSCGTSAGTGGLYLLRPDTVSTQKIIITTLVSSSHTSVAQVADPWGFKVTASGYPTTPSIIKL